MSNSDFKIKLVKSSKDSLKNIREKLNEDMGIVKLQSYFPILKNYFDFYNDSNVEFTLKSRYRIKQIINKLDHKIDDYYVKNFFNCMIREVPSGKEFESKVFVKVLPLLNVVSYLVNSYKLENSCLPDDYYLKTLKKINNPNNSAYIDVFFSYLGSLLTEKGKCPTFPLYFGSFSGLQNQFKFDISEDFDDLKENDDFISGLGNKFQIEDFEIDEDVAINHNLLNQNCEIEADEIDDDFDFEPDESLAVNVDREDIVKTEIDIDLSQVDIKSNKLSKSLLDELLSDETDNDNLNTCNNCPCEVGSASNSGSATDGDSGSATDGDSGSATDDLSEDIRILNSDCSFSDISMSSRDSKKMRYCNIPNFPVQLNLIETLDETLDNYLDNSIERKVTPMEWRSILFQICFGLAVAQKNFLFVHNDLHSSNIMFKKTQKRFLYFKANEKFYKIPTFEKITKIIDFGRATFKIKNKIYFSDVFMKNEDAWGQYTYPTNNSLNGCKNKPNMNFDLARFATTIIERFDNYDEEYDDIRDLLNQWMTDKYGNNFSDLEEDFDLYKMIARNAKNANPKKQLNKKIWSCFEISENSIPKSEFIYKF